MQQTAGHLLSESTSIYPALWLCKVLARQGAIHPVALQLSAHLCAHLQVYETHARIAIEVSDWAEYRQCHSVLQKLFADGLRVSAAV